jgi:hypothetical protein
MTTAKTGRILFIYYNIVKKPLTGAFANGVEIKEEQLLA